MPWEDGYQVNGQPAKGLQNGNDLEALWGGQGAPDGEGKGHLVSHDGVNANYLREPGNPDPIVDDFRSQVYDKS